MKQLASTFTDGMIRYYLADSDTDEIDEIAIIKPGPAFGGTPAGMVALGFGLYHEAGYNGHGKGGPGQPALVAEPHVPTSLPPAPPTTRGRGQFKGRVHSLTTEQVVDYISQHPGVRPVEVAQALGFKAQVVTNRLYAYKVGCQRKGITPAVRRVKGNGNVVRYYPA